MTQYDVEFVATITGIEATSEQDAKNRVARAFQYTLEIKSSRAFKSEEQD